MLTLPTNSRAAIRPFRRLLIVVGVLIFVPSLCLAIPVADYQKQLESALELLGAQVLADHKDDDAAYGERINAVTASIRKDLPEKQTVQLDQQVVDVDNRWLHSALDSLERTSGEERQRLLINTLEQLNALEHSVAETQKPGASALDKSEAHKRLEGILNRPEYTKGPQGQNALMRLLRQFFSWLEQFLPKSKPIQGGNAGTLSFAVRIIILAIALAVIGLAVVAVIRKLPRRQKKPKKVREARIVLGERLEPEVSSTDLLANAEALARNGDIRGAIRKAYIALLVELADRHMLSLAQHKTNRDYVRSVKNVPVLHSNMLTLTDSFERHWYGFIEATPSDWQNFRSSYTSALQTKS
jgi:hypothetical protein